MDNGWIKLYRSLEQWDWWDDHNTTRLWTWILLHANHEENKWRGKIIKSGQFISSQPKMAEATGLGVQSIRTSLNKLKSTGELTVETPHGYSLIQVNNWQKYQDTNTPSNRRTNRRLTGDQQATNNKQELKNERIKELKNNTLGDLKSPEGDPFEIFWKAYPRKTGKEAARKIWIRLRPSKLLLDKMIYAIKEQRASDQWQKDGGQFIPHPATWLNQGRWQDEQIEKERPKVKHSDITGYDSLGRPLYNLD